MANCDLPKEILFDIFSRLPTKSVGKCRTLSKSWKTHLSTTIFIMKHLITRQQTTQLENVALITQLDRVKIVSSPTRNNNVFRRRSNCFLDVLLGVVGSCNGLILLNVRGNDLLLVNPVTLKQVTICPKSESCNSVLFGFGYDCCAGDYKIVKLSTLWSMYDEQDTTFADVYSVRTNVWKRIGYPYGGDFPSSYASEGGAFVSGSVHWFICRRPFHSCIVAFDLANEVFREIDVPLGFVGGRGNGIGLSVLGGSLSIIVNFSEGVTDIWILKEYGVAESWVRFHIKSDEWDSITATLCFVEDGKLLCLASSGHLFVCDLKRGAVKKVILGEDDWYKHGLAFTDSLVSPEYSVER